MNCMGEKNNYAHVTEVTGESVSREQINRMLNRYHFARGYCQKREVLELACGSGQGLGYLSKGAKRITGGDYCGPLLRTAQDHYRTRLPLVQLDAQKVPFRDGSFDAVILYEAIYYLGDCASFTRECYRILRPGGILLLCTANRDLPDFNPSPLSHRYFSPPDFSDLLTPVGFRVECFADFPVDYHSPKQRVLSWVKKSMVRLDLMPKTMAGKKIFKRLLFGKLVPLPPEITEDMGAPQNPTPISLHEKDTSHKVLFAVAKK